MRQKEAKVFYNVDTNGIEIWTDNNLGKNGDADETTAFRLYIYLKELQNAGYKITFGM
jgi:hypothetical protein